MKVAYISQSGDECEPTPPATQWMETQSRAMNGGHCEGMAVVAGLFATGGLNAGNFGAETAKQLARVGNVKLQREIG